MNKPRNIGTAAETAVVRALRAHGFPHAERRALAGSQDCGDITGTPGVAWEVKGGSAAASASDGQVEAWLAETETERVNARADIGILVLNRKGIGPANADRWWAVVRASSVLPYYGPDVVIRVLLRDVCVLLRDAGHGDAPDEPLVSPVLRHRLIQVLQIRHT